MPQALSMEHKFLPTALPPRPVPDQASSPVLTGLESVSATPGSRSRLMRAPERACKWLAAYLLRPATPAAANGVTPRKLEAEEQALLTEQQQATRASATCSATTIALAVLSTAAIGALGTAMYYRRGNEPGNSVSTLDMNTMAPAMYDAPYAAALAGLPPAIPPSLLPVMETARDRLVARFPGIIPEAVAQQLIEPLMTLLVNSTDGRTFNATQQQQLAVLADVLVTTLTTPEYLLLYREARLASDHIDILNRFIAWSGYPYVLINGQGYLLRKMPAGAPYIVDNQGRCRFIRFNHNQTAWEYVTERNNLVYSAHNQEWASRLGISLARLPSDARVIFDASEDLVNITIPGKPYSQGLFVGARFIPVATAERLKQQPLTVVKPRTREPCEPPVGLRTISKTGYGWVFEQPTTRMDDHLKRLLENKFRCISTSPQPPIDSNPDAEGLCTDSLGRKLIKKDALFFNVGYLWDTATEKEYLSLTDFPGSFIEYKHGVMLLKHAEDSLTSLNSRKMKSPLHPAAPFVTENDLVDFLQLYGFTSSAKATEPLPLPGLARGHDDSLVFTLNEDSYAVSDYSADQFRIRHVDTPWERYNDIVIWRAGDSLLRVRPGTISLAYSPLPFHYPDSSHHQPVVIETDVHQRLQNNIASGAGVPAPKNLIAQQKFPLPILWSDSHQQKDYFYYNGSYFPATVIDAKESANPLGVDCLAVYAKGDFFSAGKLIDTLVIDKKNNRTEIKSQQGYLAENTRVGKEMAALYITEFPWRHANITDIVQAAAINKAQEYHFIAPLPASTAKKPSSPDAARAAGGLYPGRASKPPLRLFSLTGTERTLTADEKALQKKVQGVIHYLKAGILTPLERALYYDSSSWPAVKYYLEAIGIHGDEFQSGVALAWRKRLQTINRQLKAENIYFTASLFPGLSGDELLNNLPVFVSREDGNVYINAHKINPTDRTQIALTSALIRGLAHACGVASNIITLRQNAGSYPPVNDALQALSAALMAGRLSRSQLKNLHQISRQYMKGNRAYRHLAGKPLVPQAAAYMIKSDPAFRAHLMLNAANLFTQLSLDMWYLQARARNQTQRDARVRAWGALRAAEPEKHKKKESEPPFHFHIPHHERIKTLPREPEHQPGTGIKEKPEDKQPARPRPAEDPPSSGEESRETEYEDWSDSSSDVSQETESEELTDSSSVESQETETDELSESSSAESQETETDELSESSSAESQDTLSEELTDSSSGTSRDTSYEDLFDSDPASLAESLSLPSPVLPAPIPPIHPVAPPALPNSLPAQIAASAALAVGGMAVGASAPELPAIRSPQNNATQTTTARVTTLATFPHEKHNQFFRRPEDQAKNSRQPFVPDSHDDVFISQDRAGSGRGREEKVFVPGHGMVTAITIPELECLGEKEVSFTQVLRWVGQTLQAPISKNAEAWQEIYHIDYLGGDCPPPENVEYLQKITIPIDILINMAMSFGKTLQPVNILQNAVGPALELIADIADGKNLTEIGAPMLINVFMATLDFMRIDLSSLTGKELSVPHEKTVTVQEKIPFNKRFSRVHNGRIYVRVDGKEYPIHTTYDEIPIVENEDGNTRTVSYSHLKDEWKFTHPEGKKLKEEALANQDKHKISLAQIANKKEMTVNENDFYTLKLEGADEVKGVYTGMDFIPAWEAKIKYDTFGYTSNNARSDGTSRILVRDEYGWGFERKSVETDEYLKILLESKDAVYDVDSLLCGPIQTDGLSYDVYGNAWLKHEYDYYKVDKKNPLTDYGEVTLPDYDDAVILFENNRFKLVRHENTFFTSKIMPVDDKEHPFFIEEGTIKYLDDYGRQVSNPLTEWVGPGLYSDPTHTNTVFAVDGNYYKVREYAPDEMHLTSFGGKSAIKFWRDEDTWLRIRDEPQDPTFDYHELVPCRRARAPGDGAECTAIFIEAELSSHLDRQIQEEMTSDRVPQLSQLRQVRQDDIPWLFQDVDTNRYYFRYAGEYFNAEIIEANNKAENPTGFPCLKITGRSDFQNSEKKIATLVMQRYSGNIKMVNLSTYIAEKLNISREEAILYLKKRAYVNLADIDQLENLSTTLQQEDELFVSQPPDTIRVSNKEISSGAIRWEVSKVLFPEHIVKSERYHVTIFNSNEPTYVYNSYVRTGIDNIKRRVDYLKETMLPDVIKALNPENHEHPIVEDYIIQAIKKDSPHFINDFERSFSTRLRIAQEELNKRKIKIMAAVYTADNSNPKYAKALGKLVYIHPDDPDNIYINLDMTDVGDNSKLMPMQELTGAILSEALRASKATSFSCELPRDQGIFININDAWQFIQNKVRHAGQNDDAVQRLHEVIADYLCKSPVHQSYRRVVTGSASDWKKFGYLLHNDPGMRAQIALNADDFLTLFTQDIHYINSVSKDDESILHPWIRGYGIRRRMMTPREDEIRQTDIIISPDFETLLLKKAPVTRAELSGIAGYHNLYQGPDNALFYRAGDVYYPAEFMGKNNRVLILGDTEEIRQAYYYNPQQGDIIPVRKPWSRINVLRYCKEADLYESTAPGFDFNEVLRFNERKGELIPTGALRLTRLPGKVTRIEYPSFNLYHPQGAPLDIYIMGHGQTLTTKSRVPGKMFINYYTSEGQALFPYKGNGDDSLGRKFAPVEIAAPGDEIKETLINAFTNDEVNYYHLAKRYNRMFVQLFSTPAHSSDLIEAAAKLFPTGEIDLHLYICRTPKETQIFPPARPSIASRLRDAGSYYTTGRPSSRWPFDQQIEGQILNKDGTFRSFLPLGEVNTYFHSSTVETLVKQSLDQYFYSQPYDIFYGLSEISQTPTYVPEYITSARAGLQENIAKAKNSLHKALGKLNNRSYKKVLRDYLAFAFDASRDDVIDEITERLNLQMSRVRDFLDESAEKGYSNFAIVSTRQTPDPHVPGLYHSFITDKEYRTTLPSAFVNPGDAYRRVYILNDSYFPLTSKEKTINYDNLRQEHTILHESSHVAGSTIDINYIKIDESDFSNNDFNIGDAQRGLRQIEDLLESGNIVKNPLWRDFVPVLNRYYQPKRALDETTVRKLLQEDPMLKANLITANADSFPVLVKHIANLELAGKRKRETVEPASWVIDKHLALFFTLTQNHYTHYIE